MISATDAALDELGRRHVVQADVAPGASLAVGLRRGDGWHFLLGAAGSLGRGRSEPVTAETPFDLASITKPFFACTVARLEAAGRLRLEATLAELLPEARGSAARDATLDLLLAHRAGLDAHRPLFAPLVARRPFDRRRALAEAAAAVRPECRAQRPANGFAAVYSDLGYLLAGEAVSTALATPLSELFRAEVSEPLGLDVGPAARWLRRMPQFVRKVAHTENVPWRGGVLRGTVHDENAWAFSGHGMAGHAGLFGTARDVARFGAALLDALQGRSAWLGSAPMERLVRARDQASLRAGFDGVSGTTSAAGTRMGPRTFGHLGFTGTSLWCDPALGIVTVILTNRVNPSRAHVAIRAARPMLQDLLVARGEALG